MKTLTRLGVRIMMVLLLTVLVFGAVPAKADEPLPQEGFSKVLPPKIWELKPPEFGEEFLIAEPTGGSANGANIVFANENEGLAALQQEVRVCHQWCEFILQVFCEHFFFSTKTGTESSGKLLLGEFSVRKERIETQEQKPLIVYRNLEVQAGGMGLAAALETNGWAGHPSVAWNPVSENYLVTFWSNTEGLPRIYAWEVSTGGNLGVANMRIGDDGKDVYRQFYPSVAVTADGRYLVVWEQDRYEKPGAFQVFGQWLSPEGQLVGESFQISTGTYEQHPKLVWVAQRNAFLVVYMYPYMDYDGFHVEIRGQWMSADGEIGRTFVMSEDSLDKGIPSLAVNSQGEVLVAWDAAGKIYGRLILADGTLLQTKILAEEKGQLLNHPKVARFGEGGFFLTWEQFPPYGYASQSRVWGKILKVIRLRSFFDLTLITERPILPEPIEPVLIAGKSLRLSETEVNQRFPGIGTWDSNGLSVWEVDNGRGGLWGRFFWQTPVQ